MALINGHDTGPVGIKHSHPSDHLKWLIPIKCDEFPELGPLFFLCPSLKESNGLPLLNLVLMGIMYYVTFSICLKVVSCAMHQRHGIMKPHYETTSYSFLSYSWVSSLSIDFPMNIFWPHDLDFQPMTLTYKLYPSTWPPCENSSLYVCLFGRYSEMDRRKDRHTHDIKTTTPITSETWGVKTMVLWY